jgi:hypothetical protein
MSPIYAVLRDAQQGAEVMRTLWPQAKALLMAGHKLELSITGERRSTEANAKLHAELAEVAQHVEWAGKRRDLECWKRLLMAAWLRARGEGVELLPALDGHGVDVVFRRTSTLTRSEMAEFIEFVLAWKAEHCQPA